MNNVKPNFKFTNEKKAFFAKSNALNKKNFTNEHIMLLISAGKRKHYDTYFSATIDLINSSNFQQCSIILCDTLQRYNIMAEERISKLEAQEKALIMGLEWLKKNKNALDSLTVSHKIIHWNYWLAHENYQEKRELIEKLFNNDLEFNLSVTHSVTEYLDRKSKRQSKILSVYCYEYIKEECAAMLLWANKDYNYLLYPDPLNQAMKYIYHKLINVQSKNTLTPLYLHFKRKTNCPQN